MLVEVDPVEVAEISRVGLLGWVDALAMKTRKGSSRRHLRKKIRPKVQFLSDFFQFGVFLLQLFFLATEPVSSVTVLTRATKRRKKAAARS